MEQVFSTARSELLRVGSEPTVTRQDRIEAAKQRLPEYSDIFNDKYFLRTLEILQHEQLNPWGRAQVMIRQGPGEVAGIDEAIAIIDKYSHLKEHGGKVYALEDGSQFESGETLLLIEGPIQDIVALETMYLGVISAETTKVSDHLDTVDLDLAKNKMAAVVEAAQGRPVMYFGARHWRYDCDQAISRAAFMGGASSCSTDVGALNIDSTGVGTIPHVLENVIAWKYGNCRAVSEAAAAFDRTIDSKVPRIALIDYANREIDDSLATARLLGARLYGVRVDTCGENIAQGAIASATHPEADRLRAAGVSLPDASHHDAKYWYGHGVTVTGVYALRKALDNAGFVGVKIVLSSGFADADKVKAFINAEETLGVRLFDSLGVGGIFPSRFAKTDIVAAGDSPDTLMPISKAGRRYNPNPRLALVIGEE